MSEVRAEEYPKAMVHPAYAPATLSGDRPGLSDAALSYHAPPGRPDRFPPVTVNNQDQEAEYLAKGYVPSGNYDPAAFVRAHYLPQAEYEPVEWPKWIDGVLYEDPNATPPEVLAREANEYPKWIDGALVRNADEERVWANREIPALAEKRLPAAVTAPVPRVDPQPPPPIDVAALKREIIGELMPAIGEVIREALGRNGGNRHNPITAEHKQKMAEGRAAAALARKKAKEALNA